MFALYTFWNEYPFLVKKGQSSTISKPFPFDKMKVLWLLIFLIWSDLQLKQYKTTGEQNLHIFFLTSPRLSRLRQFQTILDKSKLCFTMQLLCYTDSNGLWSGIFFFIKSKVIVPKWTSKKKNLDTLFGMNILF